jgi:DNA replication protein DnaC
MQNQILHVLRELKLSGMVMALQAQWEKPLNQDLSFEERLDLILNSELTYRCDKRVARLIRDAGFTQMARMEDLIYNDSRGISKQQLLSLFRSDFIHAAQDLLITGATGCGKSYIAMAIGYNACRKGLKVKYVKLPLYLDALCVSQANGTYAKELANLARAELVILDDLGLSPLTAKHRHVFFNIIEERHKLKSTIITSQLPVSSWHDYINEPTLADAIIDRLLANTHRIDLKGKSMRKPQKMEYDATASN